MSQKSNITIEDLQPIRPQELELINLMRTKYRFGSIEILIRDGVPIDIVKTVERERLSA